MRRILLLSVLLVLLAGFTLTGSAANVPDPVPHVLVFELDDGHTCVTDYRAGEPFTQCFCACEEDELEIIVEYIDEPNPKPKPTPRPAPEADKRCNRGIGNGLENCDPGNSGGKPGKAGEDNE